VILFVCLRRKSVSGNWKANVGSALLEQIPVTDRMKKWLEEVSSSFGGMDICAIEAVIGKDGREYIIEINGSNLSLLGDSQDEDRKQISEMIFQRMNTQCRVC